jgi:DNA-binding MurR/RpiR family transcriptional regulator
MTLQFPHMPDQITKSESRILDYISNNTEEFLISSIGEVGDKLDVSGTTISRFVRRLGCVDYKELRRLVADQSSSEGPAAKLMQTLNSDEGFTIDSWIIRQQMYLKKTLEGLDRDEFKKAVSALLNSRRIFIHAKSASFSLGQLLMFRLRRLGLQSVLLPSGGSEVLEGLSQATKDDLVVMFSFSKLSQEGKMITAYQKEAGYKTLAFISRSFIPEEERADIMLFAYRGEAKEYHSMAAPAALVDALIVALSEQMGEASVESLSHLHHMKKTYAPNR